MQRFHRLKISKYHQETNDCTHISFEIPSHLKHQFFFRQGQYINVRFVLDGEEFRRSYSIVNAPSDGNSELEILVKHIENGKVSTHLNQNVKLGDEIEVMPPQGHFFANHHSSNEKTYVGIAAGSGISPVLSNIAEALNQEPKSNAYLFFGNRSFSDIIFREKIEHLVEKFSERLKVIYLLSREKHSDDALFEGRISPEKLDELFCRFPEISVQETTFFICGPAEMIKEISEHLKIEKKVPPLQVLYEYYSPPDDEDSVERSEEFRKIPNIESFVTLIIDDDEYDFHLNSKKESILDKALKEQLPLQFACKGGVCCTCKAKVLEGEVFMEKNYALTEDELKNGFVLTCQSHPVTNIVMLSFDV
jgi:ring-1,2-phenylacetyl-CoA epoxidase subunit PaaE